MVSQEEKKCIQHNWIPKTKQTREGLMYLVCDFELADFRAILPVPGAVATLTIRGNQIGVVDGADG